MVPEVADYLRQNALSKVQDAYSNEYNIKALVKRNSATPNNININVTMLDEMSDLVNPQSCSDPRTPCCTLYPSNDFSETKCIINKIINQPTKQYVCLYPTAEDPSVTYFYIKTDNDKPSSAYANGEALGDANFYVYDDYRTYDTALTQKTSINVPVQYIYDYIHKEGCDNECLLIPLNISVSSTGSLELSDLSLKYSYQIRREEKSFKSLIFIPESVKYDGKIRVDLNKLDDVISPSSLGKSTIYAKFNGLESKKINFEVVRSPSAFIRYGPFNPGINEEVNFDASTSKAESGKKLVSYIWDFGDDNIGNGTNTKHIYLQSGNYTVTLKVTDSDGVYGIDRVIINVQNGGNMNINSIVNNTLTSINLFKSKLDSSSAQIKDTANLLKINALLSNLESNLTAIKQSYNSLLADSNVSDAQISETINSLIKQAIAINNQIPSKFTADSASFSGKVTGLNQITSCCEFTTDIQKTKMLAAQQSVRVEGEVRIINIVYNSGRIENFMIIKKDIVGTGSKVYEFVPFGFSINPENVLVGGVVSAPAPNVYSFSPTNQIVYKIDTADLGKALQTRTAVLPGNLESITVNASQKESEVKPEPSVCGNKICESDEDEIGCAKDCKEKSRLPFVIIGVIVILAVLVAYFGYFFKGGLLRKKKFMPLDSKKLFKNEKDHNLVKDFVNDSLNKGLSEDKIKVALKSKGWNDMQINSVINETKLSKHKQQFIEKGAHLKH